MDNLPSLKIAVLIPCYNEEKTIARVIGDFKRELPGADIYVFDNNSLDGSAALAARSGAVVIKEKRQGKGFVVSSMLKKVAADIYVMVDADDTYPAEKVHELMAPILNESADMVVGQRLSDYTETAFPSFHIFGNKLVCQLINLIFGARLQDPMSGYRAFTRELALELPVVAFGFDVETEMTIQLLYRKFVIQEIPVPYRNRPAGSVSKLNTIKDGIQVIRKIFSITRAYKPLTLFGGVGILLVLASLFFGLAAMNQYTAIQGSPALLWLGLATILCFISGIILGAVGIILHTLNFRLLELSSTIIKYGRNRAPLDSAPSGEGDHLNGVRR